MKYIWIILFVISYALFLRHLMHMFQLNSYKIDEQTAWMKRSRGGLILKEAVPVIIVLAVLLPFRMGAAGTLVLWAVNTIILLLQLRRKAKKPLVYTMRVIRMLVTHGIILLIVMILLVIIPSDSMVPLQVGTAVLYFVLPLMIFVVNMINAPLQKAVNNRFIGEARRKIEDMKLSGLKVIGITGSYGKTSVKFFLTDLLSGKYNVLCTPKNFNTDLGVTRTIREDLNATHQIFVCEMGARHVRDIKDICDIVHPEYGIITSIGPQHLETFGSIQNIVKTKFELYDSVPDDGMMFLNYDNEYIREHEKTKPQKGFGKDASAEFRITDIAMSSEGSRFTMTIGGESEEFTTGLIGEYNIMDIAAAIAVAYSMGVSVKELKRRVKKLSPVEHRLQLLPKNGRVSIIDDAYNSNPNGFRGALDTIAYFDAVKIIVTPGMIELGEKEYELNFEAGRHAAEVCDYVFFVGKNQTKPLRDGADSVESFDKDRLYVVDRIEQIWPIINNIPGSDLVVLLENDLPDNY